MVERMKDVVQRRGWKRFHWWVEGRGIHWRGGRRGKGGGAALPPPERSRPETPGSLPRSRCRSSQPHGSADMLCGKLQPPGWGGMWGLELEALGRNVGPRAPPRPSR
jgi:hypothetical protein